MEARNDMVRRQTVERRRNNRFCERIGALVLENMQSTKHYVWFTNTESFLGQGAFAKVYVGKDLATGNKVAVKVCDLHQGDGYDRYTEDVDFLKSFKSEYITKYYAAEKVTGDSVPPQLAIVMELADGSLGSELKKEENRYGISKPAFCVLVDNCVKALEYLHFKKLSHRDIKPDNVLLFHRKEEPIPAFKIGDFGLSRILSVQNESMISRLGTPAYWPYLGDLTTSDDGRTYTKDEVDIWSTTCCFFHAATGRFPFKPRELSREGKDRLLKNRPPNTVCAQFDKQSGRDIYRSEMPQQHKSYSKSFREILARYFQLVFNMDKEYLELKKFSSLSEEMVSIEEHDYYCLNTSTVETYCDTSSAINFPRKTFLDEIAKVVQQALGDIDKIHTSATCQKICQALEEDDETVRKTIPQPKYKKPLVAALLSYQLSQQSPDSLCVATLSGTSHSVRLELQDNACAEAVTKLNCSVKQLVEEKAIPSLVTYLKSCAKDATSANEETNLLRLAEKDGDSDSAQTALNASMGAISLRSDPTSLLEDEADLNDMNLASRGPLMSAAIHGQTGIVSQLINQGADANVANNNVTYLQSRARHAIPATEEPNLPRLAETDGDNDPLRAALNGAVQAYSFFSNPTSLLEDGYDLNDTNLIGRTPLMSAAIHGQRDIVSQLINQGADVNVANNNGWTAIIGAARWNRLDVIKTLVENGADVKATNNDGDTALHWACKKGYFSTAEYLLNMGADMNAENHDGETPLALAERNLPFNWNRREKARVAHLLRGRGART